MTCAQAIFDAPISNTFLIPRRIDFNMILSLDVAESVPTERFRQFCALVGLANIFQLQTFFYTPCI